MSGEHEGVVRDEVYGFWRLDPLPEAMERSEFYESRYYHLIRSGGRAPELRRLMSDQETAEGERQWLRHTIYADMELAIRAHAPGPAVLDVGCGTGEFVAFLADQGLDPVGIEPSVEAADVACERGLPVESGTLETFVPSAGKDDRQRFDAVTMLNVLEHVPDPLRMLELAVSCLSPGGALCIRVPNDFNQLQRVARDASDREPWWIARPDHINYFDAESLGRLMSAAGADVVETTTDFPMELFLLMGEDYISDSAVGEACHKRRVSMELALPPEMRRALYGAFSAVGIGRNCVVVGRVRG